MPEFLTPSTATPEPVNPQDSVLRHYFALEAASHDMLAAARAGDWDSVCRLEGACSVVIVKLRKEAKDRPLKPHEQADRMRVLRTILANDAEIRRICDPWPAFVDSQNFCVGDVSSAVH